VPLFLGIHALYPITVIALPSTPVFGGVKHWMPAMPFLCLVGGIAFVALLRAILTSIKPAHPVRRIGAVAVVCAAVLVPAARDTLHAHPNGTAYYNELIGGPQGAARAGMQRQFWGYPTRLALEYLNEHVPARGSVYFHKSVRDAWEAYRKGGLLRKDIRHVADIFKWGEIDDRIARTAYAVYHHQKDHDEYELAIWRAYGTEIPVKQWVYDGVPVLSVYRNPSP